jgi:hypothetical protein
MRQVPDPLQRVFCQSKTIVRGQQSFATLLMKAIWTG